MAIENGDGMIPSPPQPLPGSFDMKVLPGGVLQLLATDPPGWALTLRGADLRQPGEVAAGTGACTSGASVVWRDEGAHITLGQVDHAVAFDAAVALLHEPILGLYARLPLARYDARARRFWARVMLIVRMPGGAWLIGCLARRRAAGTG